MKEYYLAVDIGASSGRHLLGYMEEGHMKVEEIHRFANGMREDATTKTWDIDYLFEEIQKGMAKCKTLGKIPVSVGIDTWAVDYVLVDKEGRRLGEAIAYRDARTEGMDRKVYDRIDEEMLYRKTGIQKQPFNTIYQLMSEYVMEDRRIEQATDLLMIPDYLHYRLSGVKATEYTNGTTTQLVSPVTKDWDWDLIRQLGYKASLFRPILMPGSYLGQLTEEVRGRVGYNCKVVLPATHDTASAVVAVPTKGNGKGEVYISSGTWSLMGTELEQAICSENSRRMNFTNEGGYDYRFRYLKNIMGLWMIQSVKKEYGNVYGFSELCTMADNARIDTIVPCNDPRFIAPSSMVKQLQEIAREQGDQVPTTPGEIAKVIYQSLAVCYGKTIEELETMTHETYDTIHVVGGGCQADYLNQLTAKETGRKVLAGPAEATAIGNLSVQMIANGLFENLQEVRATIYESFPMSTWT